jgi:hypothetical protein
VSEPGRLGGRLLDACIAVFLGAMALYGAVTILRAIWVYLCILLAVIVIGAGLWWVISRRLGRW